MFLKKGFLNLRIRFYFLYLLMILILFIIFLWKLLERGGIKDLIILSSWMGIV